jgi:hypothetical protein
MLHQDFPIYIPARLHLARIRDIRVIRGVFYFLFYYCGLYRWHG